MNSTTIIVVPAPTPKECMLVEGKRFCRESETTPKDDAIAFLLFLVFFALWGAICFTGFIVGSKFEREGTGMLLGAVGFPIAIALIVIFCE